MTDALEKARARAAEQRAAGEAPKQADVFERFERSDTRKSAIDAFCGQCMGGPVQAGYRELIRGCTSGPDAAVPCPLFAWRPYQ